MRREYSLKEKEMLEEIASAILELVDKYPKLRSCITQNGHFNGRVHSAENMGSLITSNFARYLINIAATVSEKDFHNLMNRITKILYKVGADPDFLDEINANHSKK